ncbi:MAG: VOC family protein [Pseudomonadota bacterium]
MPGKRAALAAWRALSYGQRQRVIAAVTEGGWGEAAGDAAAFAVAAELLQAQAVSDDDALRLNQVTLPCTDVRRSIAFYVGLGFELIVDSPAYARFLCPGGDATFSVHQVDAVAADTGVVTYFETAALDSVVEALAEGGYAFLAEPEDQPWLWREARLTDPDGNVICLYFAGDNRIDPPWRVNRR